MTAHLLTFNAGSSSLKFAMFPVEAGPAELRGEIDGLGHAAHFKAIDNAGTVLIDKRYESGAIATCAEAMPILIEWLEATYPAYPIIAVGHRIVHGGLHYAEPVRLDDTAVQTLHGIEPLAPLHQPFNLAAVHAARVTFPEAVQIGCFDTAFHRAHPFVADTFALPRRYFAEGVRRYGFHGLSYEYVAGRLAALEPALHAGKVIVAHLGSGASMCALEGGRSIASTMGFSALDGLPMGTRTGQIDPGVLLYLITERGLSAEALTDLLYKKSGLLGLSEISNDMRTLEASDDPRANDAIGYFVHRIRREIGGLAAALGGLDGLVFTGGIGEHSARVRREATMGLDFLGIRLDDNANRRNATLISDGSAHVKVLVIPTDEEAMIARHVRELIGC